MSRAAIYVRTSTVEQSGRGQRDALEAAARGRGFDAVRVFEDRGYSGKSKKHPPGLAEARAMAVAGRLDVLLVAALDRLGRSPIRVLTLMHELYGCGCAVVSLRESIDLATPAGEVMAHLLAAFAGFEGRLISDRTKADLAAAKARGVRLGRKPRAVVAAELLDARDALAGGAQITDVARRLGVSRQTLRRRLAELEPTG